MLWEEWRRGKWPCEDPVMGEALNSVLRLGQKEVDNKGPTKLRKISYPAELCDSLPRLLGSERSERIIGITLLTRALGVC